MSTPNVPDFVRRAGRVAVHQFAGGAVAAIVVRLAAGYEINTPELANDVRASKRWLKRNGFVYDSRRWSWVWESKGKEGTRA